MMNKQYYGTSGKEPKWITYGDHMIRIVLVLVLILSLLSPLIRSYLKSQNIDI